LCLYNPAGNVGTQHPFGADTSKCNVPLPVLSLHAEDPIQNAVSLHAEEETQHHELLSNQSHAGQSVLSVGALVGIVVGSILGIAVIIVVAIQLRAANTPSLN